MIVLDTNVLSEILRPAPDARPLAWLEAQSRGSLFTTAVTQAELLYGVQLLPSGQRKAVLQQALEAIFETDMAGQTLDFDAEAARSYADIAASRKAAGKPISQFDAMIAAITRSRGARLATRNVKDFEGCGIQVIDPWSS
ncbi:MAG: type II toxin-antitoxin system VapC family toxin [Comamonadaceae bacterium]|nr:MAG: type II toxin-antitoxin system VapC family toxin [Comamonadaceae bacterium]